MVLAGYPARYRKTETGTVPCPRSIRAIEPLENTIAILWRDAGSVVTDDDASPIAFGCQTHGDSRSRVPYRVVEQDP